jgi:twitching motility two-component system response regulator PilH
MANRKIMIVEDSSTYIRIISDILSSGPYELITATDGEQALTMVPQERPDLILLDVILPKRNGFQVCRQLKTTPDTKNIKIIMLTSKSLDSDRYWGLQQGADDYITKPFEKEDLLNSITQLLQ